MSRTSPGDSVVMVCVTVIPLLTDRPQKELKFVWRNGDLREAAMMRMKSWFKQLLIIAVVALAPATVLAFDPSFIHASVLDPSIPQSASAYLEGIGFLSPWFITEVPPSMKDVSLTQRVLPVRLLGLYVTAFIVVAVLWFLIRLVGNAVLAARRLGESRSWMG